jgi:hypothetical protein
VLAALAVRPARADNGADLDCRICRRTRTTELGRGAREPHRDDDRRAAGRRRCEGDTDRARLAAGRKPDSAWYVGVRFDPTGQLYEPRHRGRAGRRQGLPAAGSGSRSPTADEVPGADLRVVTVRIPQRVRVKRTQVVAGKRD